MPIRSSGNRRGIRVPAVSLRLDVGADHTNKADEIARQIRQAMSSGILRPGDRIASTRQLAADVGVARGTALTALELLAAEGLLETERGIGTFVSRDAGKTATRLAAGKNPLPAPKFSLVPDVDREEGRADQLPTMQTVRFGVSGTHLASLYVICCKRAAVKQLWRPKGKLGIA